VLAAGFIVLVLGALADIAHFVDGHEGSAAPATVLLQQDNAGPPATAIITETTATPVPPPLAAPTLDPGTVFDPVFNTHTVAAGDVLYDIASRYGTTTQVLIDLNELADPNRIEVGQVLALPEATTES
jgi:LysM repeat protein